MYRNKVVGDIRKDFEETLEYCHTIDLDFCKNRGLVTRGIQSIMRVFAPLL